MTPDNKSRRRAEGERGFALIFAVLLTVLVAGMGVAMLVDSTTETKANANFRSSIQAFYVARSGLEEARARIPASNASTIGVPPGIDNVTYLVAPGVDPTDVSNAYYDREYAAEFAGVTPTVAPLISSIQAAGALPYQWVRVTLKTENSSGRDTNHDGLLDDVRPIYFDGANQNLSSSGLPVYRITSLAVLPDGSRSMLQIDGSEPPPFVPTAALASQDDIKLQGSFSVSGNNYCGSGTVYGVQTTASIDTAGNAGGVTGLTGPSPNETGTYENAPSTYDITTLINSLKAYATPIQQVDPSVTYDASRGTYSGSNVQVGTPPPPPPPDGNNGTPVITYVGGNLSLSSNNSQGDGILIVDGDLNVNGGFYYYGLIVVKGIVSFTGGGSSSVNIYGAIVAGSSFTSSDNVGGGVNVQYDSCAVQSPFDGLPLRILSFREIVNY